MDDGWVKLYRKFLNWGWFKKSEMVQLFVYILLKANTMDREFEGMVVKRGQFVTSRKSIHEDTGLSEQTIRTCLKRLVNGNEISVKSTKAFTVITVSKYETYNVAKKENNQQPTNSQPTNNQQLTISKEYKKEEDIIESPNGDSTSSANADDVSKPSQRTRKPRKKKPEEYTIVWKCRLAFAKYFQETYNDAYYFKAADMAALKQLVDQIIFSRKSKGMAIDDENVLNAFVLFLNAINKDWIKNNFSVLNINSKYNEIISEIKNRNHGSRQNTKNGSDKRRGVEITATSAKDYEGAF